MVLNFGQLVCPTQKLNALSVSQVRSMPKFSFNLPYPGNQKTGTLETKISLQLTRTVKTSSKYNFKANKQTNNKDNEILSGANIKLHDHPLQSGHHMSHIFPATYECRMIV